MKVRLEDQRIVFRLNEEERKELLKTEFIDVKIDLGIEELIFSLTLSNNVNALTLDYSQGHTNILMPYSFMEEWDDVKVGFEDDLQFENGKTLRVLIEKDLKRSKKRN